MNIRAFLLLLLLAFIFSCVGGDKSSLRLWEKHETEYDKIVEHLRAGKLQKIYGRSGYEIPDTFSVKPFCGSIVFRETDFVYDSSFSILFRLGFDSSKQLRTYPTIVYTDNLQRINEYNSKPEVAKQLKHRWYLLSNY
jgi:hypothetical protein